MSFGEKLSKFWHTAGEDVYIHKNTGEIYIPNIGGKTPSDFNAANWRKARKSEVNKLKSQYALQQRLKNKQITSGIYNSAKGKITGTTGLFKKAPRFVWRHKSKIPTLAKGIASNAVEGSLNATEKFTETANRFSYVAPSPVRIFAYAWSKMSSSMKWMIAITFAFIILFVPWGLFYYAGWALGAGIMFLLSLIYWGFINLFNGVAYILVSIINGIATIILTMVIKVVEAIVKLLMLDTTFSWVQGRDLRAHSLISFNQIATAPHLMTVSAPKWQPWMNSAIITKITDLIGLKNISRMYANVGSGIADTISKLPSGQAVMLTILLPLLAFIVILAWIYHKEKYELMS